MNKDFTKHNQALALKELGFDEPCNTCYDKLEIVASYGASVFDYKNYNTSGYMVSRPTFSQAFRWFREKYGLYSAIVPKKSWPDNFVSGIEWYVEICGGNGIEIGPDGTYSYKEAESACLDKLIEITKNK